MLEDLGKSSTNDFFNLFTICRFFAARSAPRWAGTLTFLAGSHGTQPHEFIGFCAMDVTESYKFPGFCAMDVAKPKTFKMSHVMDR